MNFLWNKVCHSNYPSEELSNLRANESILMRFSKIKNFKGLSSFKESAKNEWKKYGFDNFKPLGFQDDNSNEQFEVFTKKIMLWKNL